MPWSEWITPAPALGGGELPGGVLSGHRGESVGFAAPEDAIGAARTAATAGTAEASSDRVIPLSAPAISDELAAIPPGESLYFGTVGRQQAWRFYSATQAGIPDVRNWFPPEMDDLEYGVDYGPRPDRDEDTDEDAYVQYEDGDAVLLGWQGIATLNLSVSPDADVRSAEIVATIDWPMPLETPIIGEPVPTATSYYDETGGVPVVSLTDGSDGDTSGPVDITAYLTGLDEFALFARTTGNPTVVLDGDNYSSTWAATPFFDVRALIQYPRFRYWIPGGILPLRQYPRNDGLRGGAPAAKPTSRQGTTARRTYL